MITTQNRLAAANIATSNLKSGTDFSIAAIMARDELSRESSEFSISKPKFIPNIYHSSMVQITNKRCSIQKLVKKIVLSFKYEKEKTRLPS